MPRPIGGVVVNTPTPEEAEKVRLILDTLWREEPLHEKDCPACDVAAEVAGALAATWDPLDNWHETEVGDGLPGDTVLIQAERVAAHVLHRRLLGVRPSVEELTRRHQERRDRLGGERWLT